MKPSWRRPTDLATLNAQFQQGLMARLGMEITAVDDQGLRGRMPIDERTLQPMGLLHGGASAALAETLASLAASLTCPDDTQALCLSLDIQHVQSGKGGWAHGKALPRQLGKRLQLWQVDIGNDAGELLSTAMVRMLLRPSDGATN